MELLNIRGQSTAPSNNLSQVLRRHPLLCYFLLAFGLTWACELPATILWHVADPYHWLAPALFLGPALSALLMTAILEGKPGVGRLLRGYMLWRVGLRWYLVVLLGIPALVLLSALTIPGAVATFRAPAPLFLLTCVLIYLFILTLDGPLGEELGWSGFALPRLQQRYGPMAGTLLLGSLWGLWHLPLYLFIPGFNGAGTGFLGIGLPFVEFVIFAIALRLLMGAPQLFAQRKLSRWKERPSVTPCQRRSPSSQPKLSRERRCDDGHKLRLSHGSRRASSPNGDKKAILLSPVFSPEQDTLISLSYLHSS